MNRQITNLLLLSILAVAFICAARSATSVGSEAAILHAPPADFKGVVAPLLAKYCSDCHSGEKPKGDLALEFVDQQQVEQRLSKDHKLFERIADRLTAVEM